MSNRNRDERDYEDQERAQRSRYSTSGHETEGEARGRSREQVRGRSDRDIQSDYSGGGYDQVGAWGSERGYGERGAADRSGFGSERGHEDHGFREAGHSRYGSEGDRLHGYPRGRDWEDRDYGHEASGSGRGHAGQGAGSSYGSQGVGEDRSRFGAASSSPGYGTHATQGYGPQGYGTQPGSESGRYGQGSQGLQGYRGTSGYSDYSRDSGLGRQGDVSGQRLSGQDYGRELGSGYGQGDRYARQGMGYRGLGPKNYTRSDERIREDLNERLTDADDLDASGLSVEVNNGIATLTGSVAQRWMKHRAEDIAEACSGVRDVRNQIQVGQSSGGWSGGQSMGSPGSLGGTTSSAGTSTTGTTASTTRTGGSGGPSQGTSA